MSQEMLLRAGGRNQEIPSQSSIWDMVHTPKLATLIGKVSRHVQGTKTEIVHQPERLHAGIATLANRHFESCCGIVLVRSLPRT